MSKYQILPALPDHDHRVVTLNRENYASSVLRGQCAWCGWEIDEEEILKLESETARR